MSISCKCYPIPGSAIFKRVAILIITTTLGYPTAVYSFTWQPTPLQYALLPDYCKARMSDHFQNRQGTWRNRFPINEAQIKHWKQKVGADFIHMHHYCAGLGWLMNAETLSSDRKTWAYKQAELEINYTIGRSRPTSPIWLEMNIAQARARAGLGKRKEAIAQLTQLQAQNPKSPDVYVVIAQILDRSGQTEEAISVLENGMAKTSEKGPLLFYLARYYYDIGDVNKAAELTPIAEAQGMKMDSLRERLGTQISP